MKIATYNVNSVNARLPVLLRWLADTRPDVVCLQELKAAQEKFPFDAFRDACYHAIRHGQKAWNGVAILARTAEPIETGRGLAGDSDDVHSRYLEGVVGGVRVGCLYLPNGNPAPVPKFDYKLRWLERFAARAAELVSLTEPVLLAGLMKWLMTVARNRVREEHRQQNAARRGGGRLLVIDPAGLEGIAGSGSSPSSEVADRELLQIIMAKLSPRERAIAEARGDGVGWDELARERGIAPDALHKQYRRAVQQALENLKSG